MAYYQNGQPYVAAQQPPPGSNQYHDPYNQPRRPSNFGTGQEPPYDAQSGAEMPYGYPSTAGMPDSNHFIPQSNDHTTPSLHHTSPGMYANRYHSQSQPSPDFPPPQLPYNPQTYAPSPTTYVPQALPVRTATNAQHTPYNPAAYADDNLLRRSSISYQHGYNPPVQPPYSVTSPTISQQQGFAGGRAPSQYGNRPVSTFQNFVQQPSAAPLPRPSAYTPPAPPPLPTLPEAGRSPTDTWQHTSTSLPGGGHQYTRSNSETRVFPTQGSQLGHGSRNGSSGHLELQSSGTVYQQSNPLPPTPGPPPPPPHASHASRPLPPPPLESDSDADYAQINGRGMMRRRTESIPQDELFNEVENAFSNLGATSTSPGYGGVNGDADRHNVRRDGLYGRPQGSNGNLAPPLPDYDYSDNSDAEAEGGLVAMHMHDQQEAADEAQRRSGSRGTYQAFSSPPLPQHEHVEEEASDDDDNFGVDISSFGGGFGGSLSYGGDPDQLAAGHSTVNGDRSHPVSSSGSMRRSGEESEADNYDYGPIHPFPPFMPPAQVDTFGTGGLAEPTGPRRRLSYDENDEVGYIEEHVARPGDPPDMFYHPGMSNRPLPPTPGGESWSPLSPGSQPFPGGRGYQTGLSQAPDGYAVSPSGTLVPRSTSLLSHSTTPSTVVMPRSKTDAEERSRIRQQQTRTSAMYTESSSTEIMTPASASAVALDLPTLPTGRRFNPSRLTSNDFSRCTEPWSLSSVISWLKSLAEGEVDLKEHAIVDGLVALFTHKVPTMNVADAETLSARVVHDMYKAGTLVQEEEWLKFGTETMTGVIFQLTGSGCYSPRLHLHHSGGRCYSYHCQRTLKKIDLHAQPTLKSNDDWASYYKVKKEDIEGINPKEIERQNILHEIVQKEDSFMDQLQVVRTLYRDALQNAQPPQIPPKRLANFLREVFGKVDAVKKANEDFLLPQLKYRQQEQGPWITGFSDIFREWIRKAKGAYIDYAAGFPKATFLVRQEAERNILFRTFLEKARSDPRSNKLGWDTYLKSPITRLQQYSLLLDTVRKRSTLEGEEKRNLETAIAEIKAVTLECDARVAEMSRKVDLTDLQSKLILRPGMQRVELNLDHLGRELIFKGDLQRTGTNKFTWLEVHALLFDHYLVLAKTIQQRDADGGMKYEKYDVSRLPIPMDLLLPESFDDAPVVKSAVRGVAVTKQAAPVPAVTLGRTPSSQSPGPGSLAHTNTNTSVSTTSSSKTIITNTILEQPNDDKIMYPFRIKHLGKETYTLFAPTAQNRQEWRDKIIEAKTKHAAALHAQNAEPFKLRVMADSAFAYEAGLGGQKSITIRGTPLDRAVQEVNQRYAMTGRPGPVCRAKVNCATTFIQPYGKPMVAVGTDFGVYLSELDNPRGWSRAIPIPKVTQVAVLEEFSLFLLISDKSLIAYHLDVVCPVGGVAPTNDSARKAPQKLSGTRDIGFFATGKMKERTLVFYKKREGLSSTFKVLEPVFQKSTEKRPRFMRMGRTEFFREYDEFYIPTECFGINLFHSSLAVSTLRGFEVLTLDKKQPWSVPDLKTKAVESIATRLANQQPLGMFRLDEQEFLLVYEECAVYVDKHGDINRSVIMEFVGKARSVAVSGRFVLLFDQDFVEIRNAQDGRLRQVIAGRDVKLLDDGSNGRSVKVAMMHPEENRCQIVVELLVNEGLKE